MAGDECVQVLESRPGRDIARLGGRREPPLRLCVRGKVMSRDEYDDCDGGKR
jgi:hypothetical protein